MSDTGEGNATLERLCTEDPLVSHLTDDVVRAALKGLPAEPVKKSYPWLARAIRGAIIAGSGLPYSLGGEMPHGERKGQSAVRDELTSLAKLANDLWSALACLSPEADEELINTAHRRRMAGPARKGKLDCPTLGYRAMTEVRQALESMGPLVAEAAAEVRDRPRATRPLGTELAQRRVELASFLAIVFEAAYGLKPVIANGGSNNSPETFGVWPDFFVRVLRAANMPAAQYNLEDVLKEARKRRVEFAPGLLPK